MKHLFLFVLALLSFTAQAQVKKGVDQLSFCGLKYPVPEGCQTGSEYSLECEEYMISWQYISSDHTSTMPASYLSQMAGTRKRFRKTQIPCFLLDQQVQGYRVSYRTPMGTTNQLIAYGVANGQPVLVQLTLNRQLRSNQDIPEFLQPIIRLSE